VVQIIVPQAVEIVTSVLARWTNFVSCGSFSATKISERFPAASRAARPIAPMMYSLDSSCTSWVASKRKPSK